LKCSIIVRGGIQPWGTVHRYHLSWRLWQPNLTECLENWGKISFHIHIAHNGTICDLSTKLFHDRNEDSETHQAIAIGIHT